MKRLLSTVLIASLFTSLNITPALALSVDALPSLNNSTNAEVTTGASNNMNVQITGGQGSVGTLNWNSYNVGKDASVNYQFTNHHQTALNKVSATGGLSEIYGKITNSSSICAGVDCGYNATGKVILINPNGVLFGDTANVNLNSFTVSTYDGNFDGETNKLQLNRTSSSGDIIINNGAKIHGDKSVNMAATNIKYTGSLISTNIDSNYVEEDGTTAAYGNVKLVTADGVNFEYYKNGGINKLSGIKASADKMEIVLNGEINSGNIDVRNYSTNTDSQINIVGGTLKATKAVAGNDGNIWLTAANKVITEGSTIQTLNATGAEARDGGNVQILANQKVSIGSTTLDAVGNIDITSQKYDVNVANSSVVKTLKDLNITADNVASIQNSSTVNANNVNLTGNYRAQVVESNVTSSNNLKMTGKDVWVKAANLKAKNITLNATNNVSGDANLNDSKTNIYANNDIDVKLSNVGNRNNGLVAEANNNLSVETDGILSVSRLVAKNGDLTLKANKVIKAVGDTTEQKLNDDLVSERGYIEVRNGKFTSITADDEYVVTASGEKVGDNNMRHHIQYGNGNEKILLVTKMPYVEGGTPSIPPVVDPTDPTDPIDPTDPTDPSGPTGPTGPTDPILPPVITPINPGEAIDAVSPNINSNQAAMLNRIPQKPQTISNVNNISDGRTTFIDVFAAASQIEVDDEED